MNRKNKKEKKKIKQTNFWEMWGGRESRSKYLYNIAANNQLSFVIKDAVAACPLLWGFRYETHFRSESNLSSWKIQDL
jgi:hypothetical protein